MGVAIARALWTRSTDAERLLWPRLRDRRLGGNKSMRQAPIGPYDCVCLRARLTVEVDDGQHAAHGAEDAQRTAWLADRSFRVLRFWNHEVLGSEPPLPPREGRGEGLA